MLTSCLPTVLSLESRVFVAFSGEDLTIDCLVKKPANQSEDTLTCFNPAHKQIYSCPIPSTAGRPKSQNIKLSLSHVNISGDYYCKYQKAAAYWFVHVRGEQVNKRALKNVDYKEMFKTEK